MTNEPFALDTDYQSVIHKTRYAKWLENEHRREHWHETVDRYVDFMVGHLEQNHGYTVPVELQERVREAILVQDVMPSMRAMMTAGAALDKCHVAGFNCSYLPIDHPRALDELLYILMCGTGVGFSCERQHVSKLPDVPEALHECDIVIKVRDSKRGWAQAFKQLLALLWAGQLPTWDVSGVRKAGARLKTFGGRASGPEPLVRLFNYTIALFKDAAGRKFESLEIHDLVCMIADIVVVGGVRRSALISLSNLSDQRMRDAKSGQWWEQAGHRRLANNSVAYSERPPVGQFMDEWTALYKSYSGERGIFNRAAARAKCEEVSRDPDWDWGTNPCGEIILRPNGFCNLTEVVLRADDDVDSIARKVEIATTIGTWQSTLTKYRYIRKKWQKNAEEERLLGVSFTGIMDCPAMNASEDREVLADRLDRMRNWARAVNLHESAQCGINPSAAITCVKPSGTVSQLVDASSGIHKRYSQHYIRRIRNDLKDPVTDFLVEAGVPHELEKRHDGLEPTNMVFSFPIAAPEGSETHEMSAIEQLEFWLVYRTHWCDHNPSTTVYVKEDEWMAVGAWVFEHFDEIGGLSFLPFDGGVYEQAPYEPIDAERYEQELAAMPNGIDWTSLIENDDETTGTQELACKGGMCEL